MNKYMRRECSSVALWVKPAMMFQLESNDELNRGSAPPSHSIVKSSDVFYLWQIIGYSLR